jgi:hypothetical protein
MGTKEEMEEHGLSIPQAMKIATDHLRIHPAYYTLLKKAGL